MSFDSGCFTSDEALCVLHTADEVPDRLSLTAELAKVMLDSGSDVADDLKELRVHTSDSMAGFSPLASKSFKSSHSTKSQPSNEEVAKYLERHHIQAFFAFVTTMLSSTLPPDPFKFLVQQISQIVAKFQERERGNPFLLELGRPSSVPEAERLPPDMSQDQQEKIILHLMTVLQSPNLTAESANVLFHQFSSGSKKLSKDKFKTLLQHLRMKWGLCIEDTVVMMEALKRWRFRANASSGTLGLPLWPLRFEDFAKCYPTLLRVVYNRYTPISGNVDRAVFIRQAAGTFDEKYEIGRKLGRGAYGEVVLVKHRMTREHRVCKKVRHRQQRMSDAELPEEVELVRRLDHPHIIRIFEYFDTEEFLFMIMEPVFGGTLAKLIGELYPFAYSSEDVVRPEPLTETWVATFMAQLLGALAYAHGAVGLVHKDLKSENILLVGKPDLCPEEVLKQPIHAMLADFGIAEVFEPDVVGAPSPTFARGNMSSSKVGGTPAYMSPEMFKGQFTEKCDIWSMGVVMFHLMTGTLPYRPRNLLAHAHSVCDPHIHPEWELLTKNKWTLGARLFSQLLLSKEEGMRPSAAEACKDNWMVRATEFADVEPSPDERMALQHQHLHSHVMRMARLCITSQLNLSPLHHLNHRFRQYDSDGNGRLNHLEMRQVLEDVGISSSEDIDLIIESLDSNDNGLIDYSEFIAGCLDLASDGMKAKLRAVFDIFDLDASGTISVDELRQVLTQGGANSTTMQQSTGLLDVLPDGKTVEDVMRDVDADGTGQIEFGEFERYLLAEHEAQGAKLAVKSLSDMCLRNMSLQHERMGEV